MNAQESLNAYKMQEKFIEFVINNRKNNPLTSVFINAIEIANTI